MPSSAQCLQIATLAAYLGRRDYFFGGAEELAQDILKLHRYGQTLGDLYAAEKTYASARRVKRIKSLEESCQELAEKLVKGLPDIRIAVRFRHRGEVPQLRDLTKLVEKAADASVRPETLAIDVTDPVGPRSFYLGGRQ